ncbi:MAG: hypothetical protein WDN03_11975 [Rhizomicrobium sp.]
MTTQSPSDRIARSSNEILEATSFLSGTNAAFVESLYAQYLENPDAVDESWRAYFQASARRGWRRPSSGAARNGAATRNRITPMAISSAP